MTHASKARGRSVSGAKAVVAGLLLVAGTAGAESPMEEPLVVGIELVRPEGFDASGLREMIAVSVGKPVSRRQIRRSIRRLFATGRLSDVIVRTEPAPQGVQVVFELVPKKHVVGMSVEGAEVIGRAQVAEVAKIAEGDEYYRERGEEAARRVQEMYRRRGYWQAKVKVDTSEAEEGVEVIFRIREGEPTRVTEITISGSPGIDLSRILSILELKLGSTLDQDQLVEKRERLKKVYREEGFFRARVGDPEVTQSDGWARVLVAISAGPRYECRFHGNRHFGDDVLRTELGYDGIESLDRSVVAQLERRLARFYRFRGFSEVQVTSREVTSPNAERAVLAFDISEGPMLAVDEIVFEGNEAMSDEALRALLEEAVRSSEPEAESREPARADPLELEGKHGESAGVPLGTRETTSVFIETAYREAAEAMAESYRQRGFLQADVLLERIDVDKEGRRARVRFKVNEGPRTLIRRVAFSGLPDGVVGEEFVLTRPGDSFSFAILERSRESLVRALGRHGFLFARIDPEVEVREEGTQALVSYRVDPGPEVRVGQVVIQGRHRSLLSLLWANLTLRSGDVLDPENLFQSQRNLVALGVFRQVNVKLIAPETVEAVKDVVVEIKERPKLSGEVGGGFTLADGPIVTGDAVYPNFMGRGMILSARAKLNYAGASALAIDGRLPSEVSGVDGLGGRGNLALHWPRVYMLPVQLGSRLDLIGERVHRTAYRFTRFSAVYGVDWAAKRWLTVSPQYEIEHDRVSSYSGVEEILSTGTRADQERLRFPTGIFSLHSLRVTGNVDFRDDPVSPTRGILLSATPEVTHDLGAYFADKGGFSRWPVYTLKMAGNVTGYVPIRPRWVLAVSLRAGRIVHLDPRSRSIPPKRFFLGGASTMRGFREEGLIPQDRRVDFRKDLADCRSLINRSGCTSVSRAIEAGREIPSEGGEFFDLGKVELRLPVFRSVDLGLFFEAGNLWLSPATLSLMDVRTVTGVGVRYGTPIGPLALDLGVNLFPDRLVNESAANLHFSIGLF